MAYGVLELLGQGLQHVFIGGKAQGHGRLAKAAAMLALVGQDALDVFFADLAVLGDDLADGARRCGGRLGGSDCGAVGPRRRRCSTESRKRSMAVAVGQRAPGAARRPTMRCWVSTAALLPSSLVRGRGITPSTAKPPMARRGVLLGAHAAVQHLQRQRGANAQRHATQDGHERELERWRGGGLQRRRGRREHVHVAERGLAFEREDWLKRATTAS